jgi:hypothetical protein
VEEDHPRYLDRWLAHVHALAEEIGPRGSTTAAERRASEYCAQVLDRLGLVPALEPFSSARSIYLPYVLAQIPMLLAFALYPLAGRASAAMGALLSLLALSSVVLELSLRDNLLRRVVPKGPSQNVVATLPPAGEHRRDLVLIGHVDSHRTPLIFRSPRWIAAYQAFVVLIFALSLAQILLYALGTVTQWGWIWPATIPTSLCALVLVAHHLHADSTPFSAGANDNATGAGLVLTLAEHLQAEPLQQTRVWLVNTGCEEVQHYGAADFFRRHRGDLRQPMALVFETLGCTAPAWLVKEGIVVPFHADAALVALAERLATEHPQWGARPAQLNGGNTEMADALRAGVPAITLLGSSDQGEPTYWHQVEDTYDKMDAEVMGRAYAFAWTFIRALDAGGCGG